MIQLLLPTEKQEVTLRQLAVEDAAPYYAAVNANRDHLSQFGDTTADKYPTLESVVDSIEHPKDPNKVRMGIWDGNKFVGSINITPEDDVAEIGYWLDNRFVGHGYATLATKALSTYAARLYPKVFAEVVEGNDASAHVLERSGFKKTAVEAGRLVFELVSPDLEPDEEIERQLDRAFANPRHITLKGRPKVSPEDLAEREAYYSRMASAPDNVMIKGYDHPPQEYEVTTEDSEQYPLLLAQAMRRLEVTKGHEDPGLGVTPELARTAKHETTHGKMAAAFGVGSRFGVRILFDPNENIWALSPSHALVGDYAGIIMLTRLQEAAIAVAPDDASPGDLHSARAAGFKDREEVMARLHEVYPDLQIDSQRLMQSNFRSSATNEVVPDLQS